MFYVSAPSGHIALHTLEECILTRLEYLELLHQNKTHELKGNFEYLLEFSNYDSVGHFTLRLLTATSKEFCHYWLSREILLFKNRLNHISPRQFCRLFKSITRQVKKRGKEGSLIDSVLLNVCSHYLQNVKHFINQTCLNECEEHPLKVNFELLPKMVQEKEVELSKGFAIVHCPQWKEVLAALFQTFIESEIFDTEFFKELVSSDPHLTYLNERLKFTPLKGEINSGQLTTSNLLVESLKFPPCMKHLHDELRLNHRLSHFARFYYSLFLKECGMTIEEALEYWRNEYSKPHLNVSICSHQWQKDSRKYTYSIKHMYGLEGSRKKYQAPTCNAICRANVNAKYEGGCPFQEFDKRKLKQVLRSILPQSEMDDFLKITSGLQPRSACRAFLKLTCKDVRDSLVVNSPADFYFAKSNRS